MEQLDSELLRTFVAVAQAKSVTEGANRVHRSQSAVSIQIKRLENILGKPVFDRHGRGVILTDTGWYLLPTAMEIISRLDATFHEITRGAVHGKIRLGIPDDHGREKLTRILGEFGKDQPDVELDVTCSLSVGFPEALRKLDLDLAIYEVADVAPQEELLFEDPTCWATSPEQDFLGYDIIPIALFDEACWWRDAAIASIEASGRKYRVVYSSQSVLGVLAAVEAGIAIGLLGRSSLKPGLETIGDAFQFAPTPTSKLVMAHKPQPDNALIALRDAVRNTFLN